MRAPAFLVVGTARSGTTLAQRLLSELDGVLVAPETHLFSRHGRRLAAARWPLRGRRLRSLVDRVCSDVHGLDPGRTREQLDGTCRDPALLFAAMLRSFDAEVVGEKTPAHLRYLPVLWERWPTLPVVALVRDPRAVAASYLAAPFGTGRLAVVARRWAEDQRFLSDLELAGRPVLVLRYEDLVTDPHAALDRLAEHVDVDRRPGSLPPAPQQLHSGAEWWKSRASEATDPSRIDVWRTVLTPAQAGVVEQITGPELRRWGYHLESAAPAPRDGPTLALARHRTANGVELLTRWRLRAIVRRARAAAEPHERC